MFNNDSTEDFFSGLFQNRPSKYVSLSFSLPFSYIAMFLIYFIIWHGKHGSDARKTIINLLITTCWWVPFLWMFVIQQYDSLRYFYGPLPTKFCQLNLFFKIYLSTCVIVLLDCIIIARYLLIFWLKNPAGIDCCCFI